MTSPNSLKELVEFTARQIVDDPDSVRVNEILGATSVVLELSVAPEDMGRVIGRDGQVANAMRTILRCLGAKQDKRVTLEIVE